MVTASSITALFLRGFKLQNLKAQFTNREICTPAFDMWLVQVPDYASKMDAYQAGLSATSRGLGVHVLPDRGNKWTWVAGMYTSEQVATQAMSLFSLPENAETKRYQISSKNFSLEPELVEPCRQILTCVENIFQQLLALRAGLEIKEDISAVQLKIIEQYNQIKSSTEDLHGLNTKLHNKLVSTVIYTANQNLLGLQELIYTDQKQTVSLTSVNTALLKTFFSLDNF